MHFEKNVDNNDVLFKCFNLLDTNNLKQADALKEPFHTLILYRSV